MIHPPTIADPRRIISLATIAVLGLLGTLPAAPPPEQLERIATLVEAGRLHEAAIRTETLLELYPEDPALTEIQSLLHATTAPPAPPPAPAHPSAFVPEVLHPDDQAEIDRTTREVDEARNLQNPLLRKQALRRLLSRPVPARAKASPAWEPYWLARTAAALEVDDAIAGCRSARQLAELKPSPAPDAHQASLLNDARTRRWLDADFARELDSAMAEHQPWLGTWIGTGRQEGTKTDLHLAVTLTLSSALKTAIHCEGTTEAEPSRTDVNWMIIKHTFELPGTYQSEMWVGEPGNDDPAEAMHFIPANGTYHLLGHDISPDQRELSIRFRYQAEKGSLQSTESAMVLRRSESGDALELKQGLNVVQINPLYIKTLTRR